MIIILVCSVQGYGFQSHDMTAVCVNHAKHITIEISVLVSASFDTTDVANGCWMRMDVLNEKRMTNVGDSASAAVSS